MSEPIVTVTATDATGKPVGQTVDISSKLASALEAVASVFDFQAVAFDTAQDFDSARIGVL